MAQSVNELALRFSGEELAFLGDGVYELCVRRHVVGAHHKAKDLSSLSNELSCASFQARAAKELFGRVLTEEEKRVFLRGRNLAHKHYPKACSKMDYKYATALECLFGFLELSQNKERIGQLFCHIIELYKGETNEL